MATLLGNNLMLLSAPAISRRACGGNSTCRFFSL
jgi:hypothetical protein